MERRQRPYAGNSDPGPRPAAGDVVLLTSTAGGWDEVVPGLVAAAGGQLDWHLHEVETGAVPDLVLREIEQTGLALTDRAGEPGPGGAPPPGAALRERLGLYLGAARYAMPADGFTATAPGIRFPHSLLVLRDLVEGVGVGPEVEPGSDTAAALAELLGGVPPGTALAVGLRSPAGTRRLLQAAFEQTERLGAHRLTLVHKGNAVKSTDGMLYRLAADVAAERRAVSHDAGCVELVGVIVDALCAELLLSPGDHDVLLVPALYGDLVEGLCAATSRRRLRPGALAATSDHIAVIEPRRGSGARPAEDALCAVAAAVQLLWYVGQVDAANRLDRAAAAGWHAVATQPLEPFARIVDSVLRRLS